MANYVYPNEVLKDKYNSVLTSEVNMNNYMTLDDSLTARDGDDVEIVTRSVTGDFEDVAMGEGNTQSIEVTGTTSKYTVLTRQGRFIYYDEQARKDSKIVDTGITGMSEKSVEKWANNAIDEFEKAYSYNVATNSINFDAFVDAVAFFGEKANNLTALVHSKTVATIRKSLKDDLKYVEAFVRTGYVGTVAGVNIVTNDRVSEGEVLIFKKDAVTLFIKKESEIEQERDANLRKNTVYSRKVAVVALTDESHVARIGAAATTASTITSYAKDTTTVAGAATTGATVRVFVNGALKATVTAASSAYTATVSTLAVGDKIMVVAHKDGQVASVANATVAA